MIDEKRLLRIEATCEQIGVCGDAADIIEDLVEEVRRLRKLIGKPLSHPVTRVAEWRWMANHIASMKPPYSDPIQNSSFIVVQKTVCEILRRLDTFQGDIE